MKATIDIDVDKDKVWDHAYPGQGRREAAKRAFEAGFNTFIFNGRFCLVNGGNPIWTDLNEEDAYRTAVVFTVTVPERGRKACVDAVVARIRDGQEWPLDGVVVERVEVIE